METFVFFKNGEDSNDFSQENSTKGSYEPGVVTTNMAAVTSCASHLYYDISGFVVSDYTSTSRRRVVCLIQRRGEYYEVLMMQTHVHVCVLQINGGDSNDLSRENSTKSS